MKTKKQQEGEMENHNLPQNVAEQSKSVDESRRRFTKSGLAVSGVLLTLASRSALGNGFVCKSPSGFLSGNVSAHGTPQTCSGLTPGYWGNRPNGWPLPYLPGTCHSQCSNVSGWTGGTIFSNVFNCNGNGSIYNTYTMMQVIWLGGGGDPYQLGAHIVAALLNARSGRTPVLTEAQVINIFNEWNQKGYFEPTVNVKWYEADIVYYLKTTMPL
ncbi:MAG: hypothetical protein EPN14_08360 [Gallionella sp.]|nr:MAG: hypothetical protein EPN14_08360 [Gallionella sp.]